MYTQPKAIILLGPPGSGKGTQAARLSAALELPAISTGEVLRRECQADSALGRKLEAELCAGRLVSDDQINRIVESRLGRKDCKAGCILDGYPRTVEQAIYLDRVLSRLGVPPPTVFDLLLSADTLIDRLEYRRQCPTCGRTFSLDRKPAGGGTVQCPNDRSMLARRDDDRPSAIRERLRIYDSHAALLVNYYQGRDYHAFSADQPADHIAEQLFCTLGLPGVLSRTPADQQMAFSACQ